MHLLPFSAVIFFSYFFFFNDTAPTEIYTLSLHDALPIWAMTPAKAAAGSGGRAEDSFTWYWVCTAAGWPPPAGANAPRDRKSTRLNSSHVEISYAVFCLKKKKNNNMSICNNTRVFIAIHR